MVLAIFKEDRLLANDYFVALNKNTSFSSCDLLVSKILLSDVSTRLDYQPLFGKGAPLLSGRNVDQTRRESGGNRAYMSSLVKF